MGTQKNHLKKTDLFFDPKHLIGLVDKNVHCIFNFSLTINGYFTLCQKNHKINLPISLENIQLLINKIEDLT